MCGIYGWDLTNCGVSKARRGVISAILSMGNDARGGDSWGWVDNDLNIQRGLGDIVDRAGAIAESHRVMAHTRKATTGGVSVGNAHPFTIGKLIGAHNGILWNHEELNKKYNRNHKVDSMHLFSHIWEGKDLKEIEAYGAIEHINKDQPTRVYLSRLRAGELSIFGIGSGPKNYSGIIWTSDSDDALNALNSAGIRKYFAFEVDKAKEYFVERGLLYVSGQTREVSDPPTSGAGVYTCGAYGGYDNPWEEAENEWKREMYGNKPWLKNEQPKTVSELMDKQAQEMPIEAYDDEEERMVVKEFREQAEMDRKARAYLTDQEYREYLDGDWVEDGSGQFVKVDKEEDNYNLGFKAGNSL